MKSRGFSLLEVLIAAALLGLVVAACLPMLRSSEIMPRTFPDRQLTELVRSDQVLTPPNAAVERFESHAGDEIEGEWIVVTTLTGFAVVWRAADDVSGDHP